MAGGEGGGLMEILFRTIGWEHFGDFQAVGDGGVTKVMQVVLSVQML